MNGSKETVTVIGLGVIGGSYATALKKLGYTVYGADCDEDTVKKLKKEASWTTRLRLQTRFCRCPT